MIEYIYIIDNRGNTPKIAKQQIVRRTGRTIYVDPNTTSSGAFGYRQQLPIDACHFSELDAIREFVGVRRGDANSLREKLVRAECDIEMCLKTMEVIRSGG